MLSAVHHNEFGFSFNELVDDVQKVLPIATQVATAAGVPMPPADQVQQVLNTARLVAGGGMPKAAPQPGGRVTTSSPSVTATVTSPPNVTMTPTAPGRRAPTATVMVGNRAQVTQAPVQQYQPAQPVQAYQPQQMPAQVPTYQPQQLQQWDLWRQQNPQQWETWRQSHPHEYAQWEAWHHGHGHRFHHRGLGLGHGGGGHHSHSGIAHGHGHHRRWRHHAQQNQDPQEVPECDPTMGPCPCDPTTGPCPPIDAGAPPGAGMAPPGADPGGPSPGVDPNAMPKKHHKKDPVADAGVPPTAPPGALGSCATRFNTTQNLWSVYCPGGTPSGLGDIFGCDMVKVGSSPTKPFGVWDLGDEEVKPLYKKWQFWAGLAGSAAVVGGGGYLIMRHRRLHNGY